MVYCLLVPYTSLALYDVEYLWLPCSAMMWLQSFFRCCGRNKRLSSLWAVAKKEKKSCYFKLFHRSTHWLDWLLIPVSLWRKHIFRHKRVRPHVDLICKCENCLGSKALCWAVLSLGIWNAEEPHFQLKSMAPVPLGKSSWLLQLYWALDSLQLCCALGLSGCP